MQPAEKQFDVALSFAGEDRAYVQRVAHILREMGIRVFYDKYETVTLWGKNLYDHSQDVYQNKARYSVMFISKHYAEKLWTNHERESAQARAFSSNQEYVLPARFDDTQIPGILPTIGYIDLTRYSPEEFAELIKQKIGPTRRFEFLPDELDIIYEQVGANTLEEREKINIIARGFFDALKLMTSDERHLLVDAISNACPAGLPDNVHLNIEKLSRLSSVPVERIMAIFARLDCLGITSTVYVKDTPDDSLCIGRNIIELRYLSLSPDVETDNATYIAVAFVDGVTENLCPECSKDAFDRLDFSILSSLTGYPE